MRLVGFVTTDADVDGFRLLRFSIACCAADASLRQVLVTGGGPDLPDDTWVEVVATYHGAVHDPDGDGGVTGVPVLRAIEHQVIDQPASPYEY